MSFHVYNVDFFTMINYYVCIAFNGNKKERGECVER